MDPDERSPEPEDRVPQDSPEGEPEPRPESEPQPEPAQAQAAEPAEPAPAGDPEPAPLEAGVAQEAQPADAQSAPEQPEPQDMAPPQPMSPPQAIPMPADPNAVSAQTAILGAPPPGPGAPPPPGVGAVPYPYPYPYPYPPNAPVPPFGDPAAAAQYAAQYPGPYPGPYPGQYPGYPPPPGGVAQPGMPVPPYPPQYAYPYAAPGAQQPMPGPMPGYPGQWPGYVPPPGQPPRKRRAGAIAGGAAAVIVAIVVISTIALTGSHSSAGLGTSPSQSGEPTYPPVIIPTDIPTDFPTGLPTGDVPAPPGLTSFTFPASAGPYTKLTGSQAQSLAASVQSTVTAEQTTLGGPLQVGVYGNGDSSTGSLTAIVMGNVVGALPELSSTVSAGDYSTFVNDFVQGAGMQNVVDSYPGTDQASACGAASASNGSTIAECVWIDNETFCIVDFSPAITGDVTGQLNFAEYDAQELRLAIDTA